jgi:hypothetical protein
MISENNKILLESYGRYIILYKKSIKNTKIYFHIID